MVFDLRKGVGTPPADMIRFTMPGRPVYDLSFDPATGYLTGVEYKHSERSICLTRSGHSTAISLSTG